MSGFLLDTNVISEVLKKRPSSRVLGKIREAEGSELATSVICVTELRFGAARHPAGRRLWERLSREVLSRLRLLPIGPEVAVRAGDLLADLESRGTPIGLEDVLIGATALHHGLAVVSRNVRHFSRIRGLSVESWWD